MGWRDQDRKDSMIIQLAREVRRRRPQTPKWHSYDIAKRFIRIHCQAPALPAGKQLEIAAAQELRIAERGREVALRQARLQKVLLDARARIHLAKIGADPVNNLVQACNALVGVLEELIGNPPDFP